MAGQTRRLSIRMKGVDVAQLQNQLSQLGYDIPDAEVKKQYFGAGTKKAVSELQSTQGVAVTGVMDEITRKQLEQSNQAKEVKPVGKKQFTITGSLLRFDGQPQIKVAVKVFRKPLRGDEVLLGQGQTDNTGTYVIKFRSEENPDLIVRVDNKTFTPVIYNAQSEEKIDLVRDGKPFRGPSEYHQITEKLLPLLKAQGIELADLKEDADANEVTTLSIKAGLDPKKVAYLNRAAQLARKTGLPQEVLYSLFQQGLPTSLPALLAQNPETQRYALLSAFRENLLSESIVLEGSTTEDYVAQICDQLRQLIIVHAFEPSSDGNAPLGDLLESVNSLHANQFTRVKQEKFLNLYFRHEGTIQDFWLSLRNDPDFKEYVEDLQFALQLGVLTQNQISLVKKLQQNKLDGKFSCLRDLVEWSVSDWLSLIDSTPAGASGNDSAKSTKYAEAMIQMLADAFPTAAIACRVKQDPIHAKDGLAKFFAQNPNFEFGTTYLPHYVQQNPNALEGIEDKEIVTRELKRIQRIYKLTRRYDDISALLKDGFHSAQSISRLGQNAFVKKYADVLRGEVSARLIHQKALQASAMALTVFAAYSPMLNAVNPSVLPTPITQTDGIPDWETLFGTFDLCDCEHCRSILSPTAYLVDILHFLSERQSILSDKTVKDILFERRPDIGEIELTCQNTNTLILYIDLVKELLEIPVAFTPFPLKLVPANALNNGEMTPWLFGAFAQNGFPLSKNATIVVIKENYMWHVIDMDKIYTIVQKPREDIYPCVISIVLRCQTNEETNILSVDPEHLTVSAYDKLAAQVYPWELPFDLWWEEACIYLNCLGVQRGEIMRLFQPRSIPPDIQIHPTIEEKAIAAEKLGISIKKFNILSSYDEGKPWEYWGYQNKPSDWKQELNVREFMQKSCLGYEELLDLLRLKYVNFDARLEIESNDPNDPFTCDTSKLIVTGLSEKHLSRIHRIVRLWRCLGWTMSEINKSILTLQPVLQDANYSPGAYYLDLLMQLSDIQQLHNALGLPVQAILSWYAPLDSGRFDLTNLDGTQPVSYYQELFQNPAISKILSDEVDPFRLNPEKTELADSETATFADEKINALVMAVLRLNKAELCLLLEGKVENKNILVANETGEKKLNLENLSRLYRITSFARATGLSIPDFLRVRQITGIEPFVNDSNPVICQSIQDTLEFIQAAKKIRSSRFSITELDYLLQYQYTEPSGIMPTEQSIRLVMEDVRNGLQKIITETSNASDPTGDLLADKLQSLQWNDGLIAQVIELLKGKTIYRESLDSLSPENIPAFPSDIAISYNSDAKQLCFTGIMTDDEKRRLLELSQSETCKETINSLYQAPRSFASFQMKCFVAQVYRVKLAQSALPDGIVFPKELRTRIWYDSDTEELCFVGTMSEAEEQTLYDLSGDQSSSGLYNEAVAELYLKTSSDEVFDQNNRFMTAEAPTSLFREATSPQFKFEAVLKLINQYLRITLSANLIKQKISEALKLNIAIVNQLLTQWSYKNDVPTERLIQVFLDDMAFCNNLDKVTETRYPVQFSTFRLLHRVAMLLNRFEVTPRQLDWLFTYGPQAGWLSINAIMPSSSVAELDSTKDLFNGWEKLVDLFALCERMPLGEDTLAAIFGILQENPDAKDSILKKISECWQWDLGELHYLQNKFNIWPFFFMQPSTIIHLENCFGLMKRLGVSAAQCFEWAKPELTYDDARCIKQAVKAKYEDVQWLTVAKPLCDVLREKQRDALVAYLVANPLMGSDEKPSWEDTNGLYSYYLIDVEMSSCQLTSRIKQAISSTQLFVQRCLMNLEHNVVADSEADARWLDWKWMKNYRVWEASRKIFLNPENWIEPELRDDKSPFFKELENELMQNDVTPEAVEEALAHYLEKLDNVNHLEICGMFHQEEPENGIDILHVFGRTAGTPHIYYYRQRINSSHWTAWEKVDVDIEGDHLLPVVWNNRLYLFWTIITEEAEKVPITMPTSDQPLVEPPKSWRVDIAWSQFMNRKWTPKKQSVATGKGVVIPQGYRGKYGIYLDKRAELDQIYITVNYPSYGNPNENTKGKITNWWRFYFSVSRDSAILEKQGWESGWVDDPVVIPRKFNRFEGYCTLNLKPPFGALDAFVAILGDPARVVELQFEQVNDYNLGEALFYSDKDRTFLVMPEKLITPNFNWHTTNAIHLGTISHLSSQLDLGQPISKFPELPSKLVSQRAGENLSSSDNWMIYPLPLADDGKRDVYRFYTFYLPQIGSFTKEFYLRGVDGLMQRDVQIVSNKFDFTAVYSPQNYAQVDQEIYRYFYPKEDINFSLQDAYGLYYWELFFHIPLLIADRLSQNQHFEEAQKWFHYIFNPTDTSNLDVPEKYWQTKPFFETSQEQYQNEQIQRLLKLLVEGIEDLELREQVDAWRADPDNPHLLARLRTTAYQKTVVMKYIDNLIAWGDQLFRRDTLETINEATQLYVLAAEILGRRPDLIPPRANPAIQTYNTLEALGLDEFSNALVLAENLIPEVNPLLHSLGWQYNPPSLLPQILCFCIPKNEKLIGYWDLVADRLFKIRNCMNIEGVVRQLPLFEPPIEPGLLVRASALGVDLTSALSDVNVALPYYRFSVMIQKAKELCAEVKSLGAALLSALEKKDGETLSFLRSKHESELLQAVRLVKENQIEEALRSIESLQKSQEVVNRRYAYYRDILFTTPAEMLHLEISNDQLNFQLRQIAAEITASILHNIPDTKIGSPTTMGSTVGGTNIGNAIQSFGAAMGLTASMLNTLGSMVATLASYSRRWDEWKLQEKLADIESKQLDKQICAARIRHAITVQELSNHDTQIKQADDVNSFLHTKFTNQELYDWMIGQISSVYFQSYQLAFDVAKRAESAYRFELGIQDSTFIQFGYWDSLKKGLLAGEKLYHDLQRMELSYLGQNRREYEITKHVSLAMLDSLALIKLRQSGECFVNLPEAIFDIDYPGHYMRRIKSVSLSVPCVTGPYTSVNGKLTLLKHSVRLTSELITKYAHNCDDQGVPIADNRFADIVGSIQSIATSSAQNDSGLFELNFHDERYLPFEGSGVVSEWHLELPEEYRQFDYNTIADVIFHIRYTARQGSEDLKNAANEYLGELLSDAENTSMVQVFSLRHNFPSEWSAFVNSSNPFSATIRKDYFPYFVQSSGKLINITEVELYCVEGKNPPQHEPIDLGTATVDLDVNGRFDISCQESAVLKREPDAEIFLIIHYSFS